MIDKEFYHVYPVNDLKEHELEGTDCWCHPDVVDGCVVVHNSFDGREETKQ